jgi:NAD(P)-dependent dehydrogenase (short-subunit alcohol dehydrogenase family)
MNLDVRQYISSLPVLPGMTDRTALITGCSSGIGRATAEAFLDEDWVVYATSRDTDDIGDLAEQGCETASLDVTVDADIQRVTERIAEEAGGVDCLVNNAGYGQYGPLEDVSTERLHSQFDVNVYGPHRLIRAVLPGMREREDGTIVNVSSFYGRVAPPGCGAYASSKFALEAMSDSLRAELDECGVDVVVVEPGIIDTDAYGRVEAELDELPRTAAYDWLYDAVEELTLAAGSASLSSEPAVVATTIRDAATAGEPEPRYVVGAGGKLLVYAGYLPDRVRDGVFRILGRVV